MAARSKAGGIVLTGDGGQDVSQLTVWTASQVGLADNGSVSWHMAITLLNICTL